MSSTSLNDAAAKGDLTQVKLLLDQGANIEATASWFGYTPLHLAAAKGHLTVVQYLLERGANIEAREMFGYTPLHLAVTKGRSSVVQLLLERGANLTVKTTWNKNARELAISKNYKNIAKLIDLHLENARNRDISKRQLVSQKESSEQKSIQDIIKLALIVGCCNYQNFNAIQVAQNDAKDIEDVLKKLGFDVTCILDPDKETICREMNYITEKRSTFAKNGKLTLCMLYIIGHGIQFQGRSYLIPVNMGREMEKLDSNAVNLEPIFNSVSHADQNGVNIVILDCCHDTLEGLGLESSLGKAYEIGVGMIKITNQSIIAYTTAKDEISQFTTKKNSYYTHLFKTILMEKDLEIRDLFQTVRIKVMEETKEKQIPFECNSLRCKIYLNNKNHSIFEDPLPIQLKIMQDEKMLNDLQSLNHVECIQYVRQAIHEGETFGLIVIRYLYHRSIEIRNNRFLSSLYDGVLSQLCHSDPSYTYHKYGIVHFNEIVNEKMLSYNVQNVTSWLEGTDKIHISEETSKAIMQFKHSVLDSIAHETEFNAQCRVIAQAISKFQLLTKNITNMFLPLLFKYLCDCIGGSGPQCCVMKNNDHSWNVVIGPDSEFYIVDLLKRPGELLREGTKDAENYKIGNLNSILYGPMQKPFDKTKVITKYIASGSFGKIFEVVIPHNGNNKKMAMKQVNLASMDDEDIRKAKKELDMLLHIRHDNINYAHLGWLEDNFLVIFMDLMDATAADFIYSLETEMQDTRKNYHQEMVYLLLGVARGLEFLHNRKILHRDLKPLNILIKYGENKSIEQVRLADFGESKQLLGTSQAMTRVGTEIYLAPEVTGDQGYTTQADIYSFGIIIGECICMRSNSKKKPFTVQEMTNKANGSKIVMDIINLQQRCVNIEPEKRPCIQEIVFELENVMYKYLIDKKQVPDR